MGTVEEKDTRDKGTIAIAAIGQSKSWFSLVLVNTQTKAFSAAPVLFDGLHNNFAVSGSAFE